MRKLIAFICLCVMLIAVGITFKTSILRSFSNYLMKQGEPQKADAMVVLSGNAFDRGNEGARLYKQGLTNRILCPGGNMEHLFLIMGDTVYESDMCKKNIAKNGVPDSLITAIHYGTSTAEEADTILGYCKAHKLRTIIVVSSLFHTRRASNVYVKRFAKEGIKVIVRGAHDSFYDENQWWQNEYGLIALNNEYVKLLYYAIKRK